MNGKTDRIKIVSLIIRNYDIDCDEDDDEDDDDDDDCGDDDGMVFMMMIMRMVIKSRELMIKIRMVLMNASLLALQLNFHLSACTRSPECGEGGQQPGL